MPEKCLSSSPGRELSGLSLALNPPWNSLRTAWGTEESRKVGLADPDGIHPVKWFLASLLVLEVKQSDTRASKDCPSSGLTPESTAMATEGPTVHS